jgi:hypothetical protein
MRKYLRKIRAAFPKAVERWTKGTVQDPLQREVLYVDLAGGYRTLWLAREKAPETPEGLPHFFVELHEAMHVWQLKNIPELKASMRLPLVGGYVRYGVEVFTYSRASWLAGRRAAAFAALLRAILSSK